MTSNVESVLDAALKLSEPEQIVLVARLLEAMPPESRGLFMDQADVDDELADGAEDDESSVVPIDAKAEMESSPVEKA